MKKLNWKLVAAAGLAVMCAVGGSFAWFNQTLTAVNPLHTDTYRGELTEKFTPPPESLRPGATLEKKVHAENTGDYPILVRVKMEEAWTREGEENPIITHSSAEHGREDNVFAVETASDASASNLAKKFLAHQAGDGDGTVADEAGNADWSVVRKNLAWQSDWVFHDGYWYYNHVLLKGESTSELLDSITLAANLDLGAYDTKDYYYIGESVDGAAPDDWILYQVTREDDGNGGTIVTGIRIDDENLGDENGDGTVNAIDMSVYLKEKGQMGKNDKLFRKNESVLNPEKRGYSDAGYTLTVTAQFVQATVGAVEAEWQLDPTETASLLTNVMAGTTDADADYVEVLHGQAYHQP